MGSKPIITRDEDGIKFVSKWSPGCGFISIKSGRAILIKIF